MAPTSQTQAWHTLTMLMERRSERHPGCVNRPVSCSCGPQGGGGGVPGPGLDELSGLPGFELQTLRASEVEKLRGASMTRSTTSVEKEVAGPKP